MKWGSCLAALLTLFTGTLAAAVNDRPDGAVEILAQTPSSLSLRFSADYSRFVGNDSAAGARSFVDPSIRIDPSSDASFLPRLGRFFIVPPTGGVSLDVRASEPLRIPARSVPQGLQEEDLYRGGAIIPARVADPVVVRGVRLAQVTAAPLLYDPTDNCYLYFPKIEAELRFNEGVEVNPVVHPVRHGYSREFLAYLSVIAENYDEFSRDNPLEASPYRGHYLIATHSRCLPYLRPLVEWRRRSGYKVDILCLIAETAANEDRVKQLIQQRYDAYLEAGEDPFDNILLVGDREFYLEEHDPDWILDAPAGETIWWVDAKHADYKYACLEGDDDWPDAAFNRFPSGNRDLMELAVARTLSYESQPYLHDRDWFTRGAVYSQHWGNDQHGAWHPTIHTNARWGVEVLERLGFDDIMFYENYDWDEWGDELGPELAQVFNDGANVLIGRAQNYHWRYNFNDVDNSDVFPINIFISGHGEGVADQQFRTGSARDIRGTVASMFGWGPPATAPMSYLWLAVVKGFLQEGMTLGWARNYATTSIESLFPDFNWRNKPLYLHVKSDLDAYGDPAIRPWLGVPKIVAADLPETMTRETRYLEIAAYDSQDDVDLAGAIATFYLPGAMPVNVEEWAAFEGMFSSSMLTDERGRAKLFIPEEVELVPGTRLYVTLTGEGIYPFQSSIEIEEDLPDLALSNVAFIETAGNGDDLPSPGESFDLEISVENIGGSQLREVSAVVRSDSRWVEVAGNQIGFGSIEAGEARVGDSVVSIRLSPSTPDGEANPGEKPLLIASLRGVDFARELPILIDPHSPCLRISGVYPDAPLEPKNPEISFEIVNAGRIASARGTARLISLDRELTILHGERDFPRLPPGARARIGAPSIALETSDRFVPGSTCDLLLSLAAVSSFEDTCRLTVNVGTSIEESPQGPDAYGYYCFDNSDIDWEEAPEYDWVEINPADGGVNIQGRNLRLAHQSPFNTGDAEVVQLGFDFQFYGEVYDRITVASNGFICLGEQPQITNFQNWPMDRAIGGGVGMIAPYWDDLKFLNNSDVFTCYDEDEGRFIVEWYRMKPNSNENAEFTFQVILFDSDAYPTPTGDSPILFQYKAVTPIRNVRNGDSEWVSNIAYASVGISSPDGRTGLNYCWNNVYNLAAAPLANRRAIKFLARGPYRTTALVFGRVRDVGAMRPISGAEISTSYGLRLDVEADGRFAFEAEIERPFTVSASAEGFTDSTTGIIHLQEGEEIDIEFSLGEPQFICSEDEIAIEADRDRVDRTLRLANPGTGIVKWEAVHRAAGEEIPDWTLRESLDVGRIVQDTRIEGAVFIGGEYYIAGANGADPNWIYILDRNGQSVGGFEQCGGSLYGMKDLDWDGELIWGSGEATCFGFNQQGEMIESFRSPFNPTVAIAWDEELELYWVCGNATEIRGVDVNGRVVAILPQDGLHKTGLACLPDAADSRRLFVFARERNTSRQMVYNVDPEEGLFELVVSLEPDEAGAPAGAFISGDYDIRRWTFGAVINDPDGDRIDLYQLSDNARWIRLDPPRGSIRPGGEIEATLSLDPTGMHPGEYNEIVEFQHNALGGGLELPVSFTVLGEFGREASRSLGFQIGWNLVSLNIEPNEGSIPTLFSPLVEAGSLIMVKDGRGRYFRPEAEGFNNIPDWSLDQGYQALVRNSCRLLVEGTTVSPRTRIRLSAGWNMVSYLPRESNSAEAGFATVLDQLIVAKNGRGQFFLPAYNFCNINRLEEGRGYQLSLREAAELIYPAGDGVASEEPYRAASRFSGLIPGEVSHSFLLLCDGANQEWEAAIYSNGALRGSGWFDENGRGGVAVWESAREDGSGRGESDLEFRLWDGGIEYGASATAIEGILRYEPDALSVVRLSDPVPEGISLNAYPNPFNGICLIDYSLPEAADVQFRVFDLTGRLMLAVDQGVQPAGRRRLALDAMRFPAGLYFGELTAGGSKESIKLLLTR